MAVGGHDVQSRAAEVAYPEGLVRQTWQLSGGCQTYPDQQRLPGAGLSDCSHGTAGKHYSCRGWQLQAKWSHPSADAVAATILVPVLPMAVLVGIHSDTLVLNVWPADIREAADMVDVLLV